MKPLKLFLLLTALTLLLLPACNHPQSKLIVEVNEEEVNEDILEITFALPNEGPTEGGMQIAILGQYFHAGTSVYIDGVLASNITIVSSGYIRCTIPAHVAGTVDLRVDDPVSGLTYTQVDGFTYSTRPFLTHMVPAQGLATGGYTVNCLGFNFQNGATIDFGGSAGTNVSFTSSNQITCDVPAGPVGAVDVTLTNPDAQFSTLLDGFTYLHPPPNPTNCQEIGTGATQGDSMGGTQVSITGTWFQMGATVTFGATPATNVVFVSANELTCTTPSGPVFSPAQGVDVVVTNPDLQVGVLTAGWTYFYVNPAPIISSINPTSGAAAGGTPVSITGSNFLSGATVTFGLANASNINVATSSSITCVTPAGSGTVNVTVTNPDTQFDTEPNAFVYVGGGSTATPGQWMQSFNLDTAANCDWWLLDFIHHSTAPTDSFFTAMTSAGIYTAGVDTNVDAFAYDLFGGQILETTSVAYGRNPNGTPISGSSFNVCFVGDGSKVSSYTLLTNYSRMCFGNNDPTSGGALGRAIVDTGGNGMEDDCVSATPTPLGCYTGELVSAWSTCPLNPALSTTDLQFLDGSYVMGTTPADDARYNQIHNFFQQLGMRQGFVSSHEIGHSLGLSHVTGSSNFIMKAALNISGTFSNTYYFFSTASRGVLATNIGYSPVYARETQTLYDSARKSAVIVRATLASAAPLPHEAARIQVTGTQYIKGAGSQTLDVFVEQPLAGLPPMGSEVLLFLVIPDPVRAPDLAGMYTLRGGETGLVSLMPAMNPQATDMMLSAALYGDTQATDAQIVARLMHDLGAGGRQATDALVALSTLPNCAAHLSAAQRLSVIQILSDPARRALHIEDLNNLVILLGHLGDDRAIDPIVNFLRENASHGQERNAAEALIKIDADQAAVRLGAAIPGSPSLALVRRLRTLGRLGVPTQWARIQPYLGVQDDAVRHAAIMAAGRAGAAQAVAPLTQILQSSTADELDQKLACLALADVAQGAGIPALVDAETAHPDPAMKTFVYDFRRNAASIRFSLLGGN